MRLGVALLVPAPISHEIDGLRRACGDGALDRVPPHLTLVPPVNVSNSRLAEALSRVRSAVAEVDELVLELGPVATFLPDSPTLYLSVHGSDEQMAGLHRVRRVVFAPPLERPLAWPFVPHVTVADELAPERIDAALRALSDYRREVRFTAVHLLREDRSGEGAAWRPLADYRFGGPYPVARGSLPLELVISGAPDPDARALLDATLDTGSGTAAVAEPPSERAWEPIVVTARRRDELVGVLTGWTDGVRSRVGMVVVSPAHRGQGIARHLYARLVATGGADGDR